MRPLITLTALLLLTACGTPTPTPPPPDTTTTTPRPTGLVITLGTVDAAMGLRSLDIQLTNHTTTPAMINGYPHLRVLDKDHTPLEVTVGHGSSGVATVDNFDTPPQPITLQPGHTVHAGLLWRNLVTQTDRKATLGTYLDIAPTPDTPTRTLRPDGGIDLGNTTTLGLSAWKPPTN
nr:DUF4232 domain-containing protein [Kibdelosporangium sp. MJ126-NF4]CEL13768.1 putative lipoprotein [Kibdelosporangium sp. MJ126-NF4]CTQ88136.1 putative lipoprotein [Kibdelosporangium sp. MJ126-NF4]